MSYTPLRLCVEPHPPAKVAKAAKADGPKAGLATVEPPIRPALAALATLAARDRLNAIADHLAERAAIVEEGAGVPADWAEGFAELEARAVPRGVSGTAWLAMMDAAGRFLDRWGGKAAALGWTAGELFGLDADAPMNRLDHRGAAFFLSEAEVVAITAEAITVQVRGSIQSIRRRERVGAPAWRKPE